MSNSFLQSFLASGLGIAAFYLLEAVYYDIKARVYGRQEQFFWDNLEEELQD